MNVVRKVSRNCSMAAPIPPANATRNGFHSIAPMVAVASRGTGSMKAPLITTFTTNIPTMSMVCRLSSLLPKVTVATVIAMIGRRELTNSRTLTVRYRSRERRTPLQLSARSCLNNMGHPVNEPRPRSATGLLARPCGQAFHTGNLDDMPSPPTRGDPTDMIQNEPSYYIAVSEPLQHQSIK